MSLQETNTYEKLNPPHCPKCREATRFKRCTPAPSLGKKQEFLSFRVSELQADCDDQSRCPIANLDMLNPLCPGNKGTALNLTVWTSVPIPKFANTRGTF